MQNWQDLGFKVENTSDGSPTLRLMDKDLLGESMHHSGGAYEETDLIYGHPIRETFAAIPSPSMLSVGMGLGYVELVIAREAIKHNQSFQLLTYESVSELVLFFLNWLNDSNSLDQQVKETYDLVLKYVCPEVSIHKQIKQTLLKAYENKDWQIMHKLAASSIHEFSAHCVCYDAFSSKTNPELWDEGFLIEFIQKSTATNCLFSTYASKGSLKRALKHNHFMVFNREGFKGKRNSTLAFRGNFTLKFPQSDEHTQ